MKKLEVISFDYKETKEFEKELNISINFDMGVVELCDEEDSEYEEVQEKLLKHIESKYNIIIPRDIKKMRLFTEDGDQGFSYFLDLWWGIMYTNI